MKQRTALSLDGFSLSFEAVAYFLAGHYRDVKLAPKAVKAVRKGRAFVEKLLARGEPIYGVNTGFGKLAGVRIADDRLEELQLNLIRSHSCGVGAPLPESTVRLAMLLRVNSLCHGNSGVRVDVLESLLAMLRKGVTPWVPEKGSVGASGDLAPLSHIMLVLIGEGRAYFKNKLMNGRAAMKAAGIKPLTLRAKEGLALINGTQIIQAIGLTAIIEARTLVKLGDLTAAMSLEALRGTDRAFDARLAKLRPHPGHALVAGNMRKLMRGSEIRESHRFGDERVQDAYSLRCIPQVHGAVRDGLGWVIEVFRRELNAVTDNPILFPDDNDVVSGGNFHGQPLAMALDYLAIAIAELGAMAERRVESMVNPDLSNLPPFLVKESGLNSGLMIAQVTAAALASENKVLCHPASVDTIPTSANKEDHVSMGVTAARKALEVIGNVRKIIVIEMLCARCALEYHRPLKTGTLTEKAVRLLMRNIKPLTRDRRIYEDFETIEALLDKGAFDDVLAKLE
ncbi:MAG: histidine ammonia-lyase [Planctomycetaceae bacterium]|nr:histidine ammonia-lyase [Planctomycetaceae bacterium]